MRKKPFSTPLAQRRTATPLPLVARAALACLLLGSASLCLAQDATPVAAQDTTPVAADSSAASETAADEKSDAFPVLQIGTGPPTLTPLEQIYQKLDLSAQEEQLFLSVRDGTLTVEDSAFYFLMGRVATFPQLDEAEMDGLDKVAVKNLIRAPQRHRGQAVQLNVRIFEIETWSLKNQKITPNRYRPGNKPIYAIFCTNADSSNDSDEPLILLSETLPPDLPEGKYQRITDRMGYPHGPRYHVAGVFYKYLTLADTGTQTKRSQNRNYPVLLAWQMKSDKPALPERWNRNPMVAIFVICFLGGVVAFVLLARSIRRKKKLSNAELFGGRYKPWRDLDEEQREEEDGEIDPALKQAAEAYRQEMGLNRIEPEEPTND